MSLGCESRISPGSVILCCLRLRPHSEGRRFGAIFFCMRIANAFIFITPLSVFLAGCTYEQRHPGYATTPVYGRDVISVPAVPPATAADRSLADLVRQQFNRYGSLAAIAPNVQVSARNGTVTLNGTVPSEQDRKMIEAMVANTPGVAAVDDQLRV